MALEADSAALGDARARLQPLLLAARRLREGRDTWSRSARTRLTASTGLSPAGVEFALVHCLETEPSQADLSALLASAPRASRAHVLLSANVFTAAHRGILLALAAAPEVWVRPSRREPEMARILLEAAPGSFRITDELRPLAEELYFAYGSQQTLDQLRRNLDPTVALRAHGPGFGLLVLDAEAIADPGVCAHHCAELARDLVPFDQRGCLSPRLVLIEGSPRLSLTFAESAAAALSAWELRVPIGRVDAEEQSQIRLFRDTARYAGDLLEFASGSVAVAPPGAPLLPAPIGRNLNVIPVANAAISAQQIASSITSYAVEGSPSLKQALARALPQARLARLGRMQSPPLDGPADPRLNVSQPKANGGAAPAHLPRPPR